MERVAPTRRRSDLWNRNYRALSSFTKLAQCGHHLFKQPLNDEAHHCYREKPPDEDEEDATVDLKGEDKAEAERNNEAARLWISGLEAVKRKLGVQRVIDLSATPFFLRGSGYAEGTLFPWTMSDFSLMDAIECGIVKLPRVPVADNIAGDEMPKFRNLWEYIRALMPKKGRGKAGELDPDSLPTPLYTALDALYGHYEKTFDKWKERGIKVPPCFIIVCKNTSTSKLVYDYVSGFVRTQPDGRSTLQQGRLPLFRNYDEHGNPLPRPRSLLIDRSSWNQAMLSTTSSGRLRRSKLTVSVRRLCNAPGIANAPKVCRNRTSCAR